MHFTSSSKMERLLLPYLLESTVSPTEQRESKVKDEGEKSNAQDTRKYFRSKNLATTPNQASKNIGGISFGGESMSHACV